MRDVHTKEADKREIHGRALFFHCLHLDSICVIARPEIGCEMRETASG